MASTALKMQKELCGQSDYYSIVAKGPMLDKVYSMRYRSYSAENYIEENSSLKFMDEYDAKLNSTCFLAYHQEKAIGSMRACVFDPKAGLSVPIVEVFEKEIRESVGYNNIFVEMNKFVMDPDFQRRGGVRARLSLMGAVLNESINKNAVAVFVAVRPEHIKFYEIFGGKLISDIKPYPLLSFKTALVVCTDLLDAQKILHGKLRAA